MAYGQMKEAGVFDPEKDQNEAFNDYIENMKEKYPDNYLKKIKEDFRKVRNYVETKETKLDEGKEYYKSLEKKPIERVKDFLNLLKNYILKQPSSKKGSREGGTIFENSFMGKYEVEKASELRRGADTEDTEASTFSHSNITLRYKSEQGGHPGISIYQDLTSEDVEFDTSQKEFRLAKGDFFNTTKELYFKGSEEVETNFENGEVAGNLFELKKVPEEKISTGVKILYSESKKVATREEFIKIFGGSEKEKLLAEYQTAKSKAANAAAATEEINKAKTEKEEAWERIKASILNINNNNITTHNNLIIFLKEEAQKSINNNKQNIINGISADLNGKGWFLVIGEENNFSFNKINIEKFVQNISLDTTEWASIKRVRLTITNEVFEENQIKKDILKLDEQLSSALERPRPAQIPAFVPRPASVQRPAFVPRPASVQRPAFVPRPAPVQNEGIIINLEVNLEGYIQTNLF
jgi:hypothetical protein